MSALALRVADAIVEFLNDPASPQATIGEDWVLPFTATREWIHRVDRAVGTDVDVFVTPGALRRMATSRSPRGTRPSAADTLVLCRTWIRKKVPGAGSSYDKEMVDNLVNLTEQIYLAMEHVKFAGARLTETTVDDDESALYDPEHLEKLGIFVAQLDQLFKKV